MLRLVKYGAGDVGGQVLLCRPLLKNDLIGSKLSRCVSSMMQTELRASRVFIEIVFVIVEFV